MQGVTVNACSGYGVEVYLFILAGWASTVNNGIKADVSAAPTAIIRSGAKSQLLPAILTEPLVVAASGLAAAYADSGPEKVIQSFNEELAPACEIFM